MKEEGHALRVKRQGYMKRPSCRAGSNLKYESERAARSYWSKSFGKKNQSEKHKF